MNETVMATTPLTETVAATPAIQQITQTHTPGPALKGIPVSLHKAPFDVKAFTDQLISEATLAKKETVPMQMVLARLIQHPEVNALLQQKKIDILKLQHGLEVENALNTEERVIHLVEAKDGTLAEGKKETLEPQKAELNYVAQEISKKLQVKAAMDKPVSAIDFFQELVYEAERGFSPMHSLKMAGVTAKNLFPEFAKERAAEAIEGDSYLATMKAAVAEGVQEGLATARGIQPMNSHLERAIANQQAAGININARSN